MQTPPPEETGAADEPSAVGTANAASAIASMLKNMPGLQATLQAARSASSAATGGGGGDGDGGGGGDSDGGSMNGAGGMPGVCAHGDGRAGSVSAASRAPRAAPSTALSRMPRT